jgi:preprotein translocase subunit YajC
MASLIFLAVAFGAMYFVLIRPQQQRVKEHQALVAAVEVGDEVCTSSGLYGVIVGFEGEQDEILRLEIADGVVVSMARNAVTEVAVEEPVGDDDEDAS